VVHAAELYHEDAVVEFPQSGERFEGRAGFTQWRSEYPADVSFRVRRVTIRQDLAVVELSASYDGGPTMYGVSLMDFRGDRIARERIYVMDGWDAPEWRAPWRSSTPADPPA
jgi:SnoaL-like domain